MQHAEELRQGSKLGSSDSWRSNRADSNADSNSSGQRPPRPVGSNLARLAVIAELVICAA